MKKILALILSLVMVFGLAACGASTEAPATTPTESGTTTGSDSTVEPIVLKFSDCHNPTATNHLAFQKMAEVVKEATNGAIEIEVYPSSQLGDVGASQEAIQMNTLDMAVTNLAVIGSVIPEFGAVGGPFLFESDEHIEGHGRRARSVLRGQGRRKGPEHLRISVHRLPSLLHLQAHQYRG